MEEISPETKIDIIDGVFNAMADIQKRHVNDLEQIASEMKKINAANASIGKK